MSANAELEDVASSSKNDESNAVPNTTPGSSCKACGDTDNLSTVEHLSLTEETGVPEKLQSLEQSCIDKTIEGTIDETIKLGAGDLGSLTNPEATDEIFSNDEISLKDNYTEIVKADNLLMGNIKPLTSTSYSESFESNDTNLKIIAKQTTEVAGYKETAIDVASDSNLELRWTDDDDEDDQMDAHTSCDQALKQLDRELNIVDAETDTNEIEDEKATAQASEIMNNDPKAVEKEHRYVESKMAKTGSYIQFLDKEVLKPFDEVHGIDDDEKSADISIDTAVAELQQLIDEDDEMVGTQPKSTQEETKPVVSGLATVSISEVKDFESMDVDEPSEINVTPTSTHTKEISLDIGLKEHDVTIPTVIADFTEPIKDELSELNITPTASNTNKISLEIGLKEHEIITPAVVDITEPIIDEASEMGDSAIVLDIIIKEPNVIPTAIADFTEPIIDKPSEIDIIATASHTKKISLEISLKENDIMTKPVADITEPIIDEASEMDASAISLDIVIKEPDVIPTTDANITELLTTPKGEDDSTVSNEVDEGMGGNYNKEMTLSIPTKMDGIASEDVITSPIEVKNHIDRNGGTRSAAIVQTDMVGIISKNNILKLSNDQRIDDSNTEIEMNNDSANAIDKGTGEHQISDIHTKDSLKTLPENIDDGKVSTECDDKSMDSNNVAEIVPEIQLDNAETKDKDSNDILTECESMISITDSKSSKENVDQNIHNTKFLSPQTETVEIKNKDGSKIDSRIIVSKAIKETEEETKRNCEISQGPVDQDVEDNDCTGTVISKMQSDNISVRGVADDNILKGYDQTMGGSDDKKTILKMQTDNVDNVSVTNVTDIEIPKVSDGPKTDGNVNTDLVSNMQTKSDEIDVSCVAENNILLKTKDYTIGGSANTEMVSKLETDKVDMPSVTDGNLNTSDDQIINDDADTEIGSKIQTNKVDTAFVAEVNITQEAKVHAMDASDNTKTVSIIDVDEVDLPTVTDGKASKESNEMNKAGANTDIASKTQTDKVGMAIADSKMSEDQAMEGNDNTITVLKMQVDKVELAAETVSEIEMEVDTASKKKDPILGGNDNINNVEATDLIPVKADEFITPDTTSDSIKINKDHRITRPDVMLDIPTQEFDFDNEFDDTNEKEAPLERMNQDACDMTSKTVTEIVNQLAKDSSPEKEVPSKDAGKMEVSIDTTEAKLDSKSNASIDKTTAEKQEVSEKVIAKDTAVIEKSCAALADKVIEKEKSNADYETTKTEEKDPKPTDQSTKTVEVDSKPSTSEVAKMTPDTLEEAQEVTDSLLAESSRVLDEDEEDDDEPEPDEDGDDGDDGDDDDDDFRPEDDNSNQTEESNSRHSEVDIQEEGIDIVFGSEADGIGMVSDSNDAEDEFKATLLGDAADITVEENDPVPIVPTKIVTEAKDIQQTPEQKAVDFEKVEQPTASEGKKTTTERRKSLLKDLLSESNDEEPPPSTKSSNKLKKLDISCASDVVNIDLEESSSEDDKESKQDVPSAADKPDKGTVDMLKSVALKRPSTGCKTVALSTKDKEVDKDKAKDGEIFNLDSDEDDSPEGAKETEKPREINQCINHNCVSISSVPYYLADRVTVAYYGAARKRRRAVCQNCLDIVRSRNEGLLAGIKDLRPLMSLRMVRPTQQLLEISDSDSEGEDDPIGEEGAKVIEEQLANLINKSWYKYKLDGRLKDTEDYLEAELEKMQKQSEEIDVLLKDCQKATDQLRVEFYSGFEPRRMELPAISLHDTPIASYTCLESEEDFNESSQLPMRYPKRRSSTAIETPAKKQAIPLGYTDMESKPTTRSSKEATEASQEDDKDISVVRLSAESAPADLPPPGELVRPPLRAGQQVYAMKNQYGAWLKGKVLETLVKTNDHQYTQCRIRFDHKVKNPCKTLSARSIAYTEPSEVRMTIGTRVIALFKNSENTNKRVSFYYSGVIAEIPNPVNGYRYLVFFDDGYAQYVPHMHTRLVCESSALVWEEVHPFSRDFVCNYLMKYPERPMVRMHQGQSLTVEWNGKWWDTKVIEVDAALVKVNFPDNRTEWIYRGSTRLQPLFAELQAARGGNRARLPRSTKANIKTNMPYVEYTRSEDQTNKAESSEELRRQRSVAKKSTTASTLPAFAAADGVVSRVVFYTPKNSVRPYKMVPHTCGPHCNRKDLLSLKELRTYNPLTKPLLSGWERQIVRHKYSRTVMYRAPCGRRVRCVRELHRYLRAVRSDMAVDLFDFSPNTHCLAEFVLNKTNVQKKDLSHGKENVPVPCVNYYDHSLPEFCSYNTERTPTAGVPLNLDPEFLCGCDCEDDCVDKRKCACWKMTLEGARTIGIESTNVGYEYRRLPEPLPSGIYECNSRCKCKATCMNRVVQNPLQLKLQVFKTLNRGWGIRALNDVPKGAFLCIYAGNLLTDATANLDGLNEGDEYLAELDYIEVVEAMKEGYEEDIPEADKKMDKKDSKKSESEPESETTESEDEDKRGKSDEMDDDFQPGYLSHGIGTFNKRLRRREKKKNKEEANVKAEEQPNEETKKEDGDECITISDDEEVRESQREPSRFTAQEGMSDSKVVSKYRSIRTYFGKDEACYIMDAKVQGNIGRYLNHSCSPNVFVQNVFVDTHDPRFPWVSFFALHHIRAGTELTWNYNYDIGSVPGKVLYCFCGAPNCRGRLL